MYDYDDTDDTEQEATLPDNETLTADYATDCGCGWDEVAR